MDDWQGCLSPACQAALKSARDSVIRRGGCAVTLEDFLLAMLDEVPDLSRFLRRQGVDLDELTRTIQCEQPIVTAIASENLLSSQLIYWFSSSREISDDAWLDWPVLLHTLVWGSDRLREKAYVAVLELVSQWPRRVSQMDSLVDQPLEVAEPLLPVVIADPQWSRFAEDICVRLSSSPRALVWVVGAPGSGKSSWLESVMTALPGGALQVDIRREAELLATDPAAIPTGNQGASVPPTLILDNVSPADLLIFINTEFSVARELVTAFPGPLLLLSADLTDAQADILALEQTLGRRLQQVPMVAASVAQKKAILTAHQPLIEKRWRIELAPDATDHVAGCENPLVSSPGQMLQWVERAAARLHLFAERGPLELEALAGQAENLRRQALLAMARQHCVAQIDSALAALALERAALENAWTERKREGALRLLRVDDLRCELVHWVAASSGSGHYTDPSGQTGELGIARP